MTNDQMREAFEQIITNNPMVPSKDDPEYDQWLFSKAWQAAYRAGQQSQGRRDAYNKGYAAGRLDGMRNAEVACMDYARSSSVLPDIACTASYCALLIQAERHREANAGAIRAAIKGAGHEG
ncbi:hypothetical protein NDR89_19640 [Cupriavidus gilardii]|uniref:Sel1 repeat family protein n=1 Tax=Cupriavidus gilardii TaxID=82541 RepID=A0ABY4VRE4_9BURK|nr:hypothetical protein [Cupriavidus gilardii]USE78852.1 hypothetical protein NDR89_19640 [Cupriavidus gilardii]